MTEYKNTINEYAYPAIDWNLLEIASTMAGTAPVYSMQTNTALTSLLDDMVGNFGKWVGIEKGFDKYFATRMGVFFGSAYLHWATTYYSHEVGHGQNRYNRGIYNLGRLDFTNWEPMLPKWGHPRLSFRSPLSNPDNLDQLNSTDSSFKILNSTVSGLNQQQLNADYYFRDSTVQGVLDLDGAYSYLFNNLADVAYHVVLGEWPRGDVQRMMEKQKEFSVEPWGQGEWAAISSVTALLSVRSWESMKVIYDYLSSGKRERRVMALNIGKAKLLPPNVSLYFSPTNYYINTETPFVFGNDVTLFFNLGSPVQDYVDPLRFGAEIYFATGSNKVIHSAFLNFNKGSLRGAMTGLELRRPLSNQFELSVAGALYQNDFMYEDIMGYGKDMPYNRWLSGFAFKTCLNRKF